MKITIIGRGNVGGALQRLLSANGHDVDALGNDGGDAADSDVVLLAVPGDAVEQALRNVSGVEGKVLIDATNPLRGRPDGVESLSAWAKSVTNGPTAKAFNTNFAALFEHAASENERPTMPICGDDEAVRVAEQLAHECGYDPLVMGGLEHAAALEDYVGGVLVPLAMTRGPFFYRFDWPRSG
ncbi:MAG TPA: NAD(P)-binding domain-containing protein [Gaiellaceae bacterium]|nr:NAD(P)-binding domain-containing protein [Gaiellaceae bacterium]